jgi:sugar phosphate isomerase/epimerase
VEEPGADIGVFDAAHIGAFVDAVRVPEAPVADVEEGTLTAAMCHLGNIATRLRRSLRWDAEKEEMRGGRGRRTAAALRVPEAVDAVTRRRFLARPRAPSRAPLVSRAGTRRPRRPLRREPVPVLQASAVAGGAPLAAAVKSLGFTGIDLTVRPGGHVAPERAAEDLPRFLKAVRDEGVAVPMITTALVSSSEPTARPILATAGAHGVALFKPGYYRYAFADVRKELADTARGAARAGRTGRAVRRRARLPQPRRVRRRRSVGRGSVLDALPPRWAGYYFDVRHAVVEGGDGGWRSALSAVAPRLKMIAVKDFFWEKGPRGWQQRNCPLGEGMVDWKAFYAAIARSGFAGPVSLHLEYEIAGATAAAKEEATLAAAARDLAVLKAGLAEAYGTS